MTSVVSDFKQSRGYFIVTSGTSVKAYTYAGGSGAGGSFVPGVMTQADVTVVTGAVLRDMGRTVLTGTLGAAGNATSTAASAGNLQRVFRKVQLLNKLPGTSTSSATIPNVSQGVSSATTNTTTGGYDTFYIELPTLGRSGGATNDVAIATVVYVPGLPGLYV
jgi:hypothetical protein